MISMMRYSLFVIYCLINLINGYLLNPPEQMHISYGNTIDSMVILWSTRNSSILELEKENIYPIIKWKKITSKRWFQRRAKTIFFEKYNNQYFTIKYYYIPIIF